jgi:hypothetical protein
MPTVDRNGYYCADVVMKNNFKYTMYLRGHSVPSMVKFTEGLFWTESVTLRDSSEEEHHNALEETSKKSKNIGFSSLENFFEEEKPKRKKKSNG